MIKKEKKKKKKKKNESRDIYMTKKNIDAAGYRTFAGVTLSERKNARQWEIASQWFAIIMLAVFPFLMDTQKYFNITKSHYVWFCVLTYIYLVVILLFSTRFLLDKKAWIKRKSKGIQKPDISQYLMMAYMLWAAVSSILSPYREDTWIGQGRYEGLMTILLYGLIFILLSFWGEYTNRYAYALGIMATVMCLLAFLQLFGVDLFTPEGYSIWGLRFFATIGNVDCVSGIAAIVIPALICAYVLLEGKWRYIYLSGFGLFFYLQIYIDVDSGKIGLLAATLVTLPFLLDRWKRAMRTVQAFGVLLAVYGIEKLFPITQEGVGFSAGKTVLLVLALGIALIILGVLLERKEHTFRLSEKQIRRIVLIVLVAAVVAALVFLYTYTGGNRLLTEISQVLHGNLTDNAGSGRGIVWKLSVDFIREMPLFGSGPDTYLSRSLPYYNSGMLTQVFDFAHNDFLQVGVCLGLGGLAIYLAWILSMAIRLLKKVPENPLLLIFGSAMVGYLGHVFFGFSIALVTPLFWVLAGLGNKCLHQMPTVQENGE